MLINSEGACRGYLGCLNATITLKADSRIGRPNDFQML